MPTDSGLGLRWQLSGRVPYDAALQEAGEEASAPADLADVRAWRDGDRILFEFVADGAHVGLVAVPGQWRRQVAGIDGATVPVAVAAGADRTGDLHVRLVFTDTPHTLRLRLSADGTGGQAWKVAPLQGPSLAAMRAH